MSKFYLSKERNIKNQNTKQKQKNPKMIATSLTIVTWSSRFMVALLAKHCLQGDKLGRLIKKVHNTNGFDARHST